MKLFRGCRHPNGRTDVLLSTPLGETWLRGLDPSGHNGKLQYDWGNDGPGARMLALDMLRSATQRPMLAELLAEEYALQVIVGLRRDHWALPSWEVLGWVLSEFECLLADMEHMPGGRMPPCPSDN